MAEDPSFEIPSRPERRYPPTGGVEYEGDVVFDLIPAGNRTATSMDRRALDEVLGDVLAADRYVRGDFFDLPAPAYLVHDAAVGTSFRVVARTGRLELHVLPHTESAGLAALYERLTVETDLDWRVERRTSDVDLDR